ncbi:MAG: polysaccharide deacetylase family protein [Chloroflexi bacterium]|nr:polysaccharide deacetylase family protein [Chloroflexota bacterium]
MTVRVALTFDAEHPDRPAAAGNAEALLAVLARRGVRATFFVQGRWAEAYPATARSIADGGHLVGHHSHYHARLPLLTDAGIAEDIRDGGAALLDATGVDPAPWFRCPFGAGAGDPRVLAAIEAAGYRHVGWDVAADDWDPDHSSAFVSDGVLRGVAAHGEGAVVLLHTWPSATLDAIEPILDGLAVAGVELCRIDELPAVPADVP